MKPSLRRIRRCRKYVRVLTRAHKRIVNHPEYKKALYDLVIFGRSAVYITATDVKNMTEEYWKTR